MKSFVCKKSYLMYSIFLPLTLNFSLFQDLKRNELICFSLVPLTPTSNSLVFHFSVLLFFLSKSRLNLLYIYMFSLFYGFIFRVFTWLSKFLVYLKFFEWFQKIIWNLRMLHFQNWKSHLFIKNIIKVKSLNC